MKATQRYTKLICLTCLTLFSIKSFAAEPVPEREDKFTIAAGVTHNSVPYTAADSITEAVPLFDTALFSLTTKMMSLFSV